MQLALALLERQAVERVAHAAHSLLVAVVNTRHAGDGKLYQRAKALRFHGAAQRRFGKLQPHLLLAAQIADVEIHAQRRAQTVNIVRAEQIHERVVHGLGVIHLLRDEKIAQGVGIRMPAHESEHRVSERIVHHAVERAAQRIIAPPAVALLYHRVLPHLAQYERVGLLRLGGGADERKRLIRQFIRHIEPPARRAAPQPRFHNAVAAENDVAFPVCVQLVDLRQILEPPPAAVFVREVPEIVPAIKLRPLPLTRADGGIVAIAVKVYAVRAGVGEHAVENYTYATLLRRRAQPLEVLLRAEDGVWAHIVRCIVTVV